MELGLRARILSILSFAGAMLISVPLSANIMAVDRRSLRVGESVTITVSLENDFASLDDVRLPLRNLSISNPPSVSSEFSFINGVVVRRKVFRYRARPLAAGPAAVGPVQLRSAEGGRDTLAAIALQILPDRAASSNVPTVVLRELLATGRDPFFVVAEIDQQSAFVGEQVVVTWWLYNATNIQQWQIGAIPKLHDFWAEELDVRNALPVSVFVDETPMQRVPIRRVALYALRPGILEIGSVEVEAAVVRRRDPGGFRFFEGTLTEISFASAPLSLEARPLPAGPAVDAVGELTLRCTQPTQSSGGPVVMDAILNGRGNLRAASSPQFRSTLLADVQRIDQGVQMSKTAADPVMTRRWRFLMFPSRSGSLTVPPMSLHVFSPLSAQRERLRCEGATVQVRSSGMNEAESGPVPLGSSAASLSRRRTLLPFAFATALAAACLALVLPWWRRRRNLDRQVRALMSGRSPAQVREAMHEHLRQRGLDSRSLLGEQTDRGDAYRALRSLLDALDQDRIEIGRPEREIRRRLRDLLVS